MAALSVPIPQVLLPQLYEQIIKTAFRQDSVKLRAIVDNDADVFDDNIVYLPFAFNAMQSIVDRGWLAFIGHDFRFYLSSVVFNGFLNEENLLVSVRTDLTDVSVPEKFGEGRDKFILSPCRMAPVLTQGLFGHFQPVETRHQSFAQQFFASVVAISGTGYNVRELLNGLLNLVCW